MNSMPEIHYFDLRHVTGQVTHIEKALQKIAATTVADSMTRDPVTVQLETSIEEIATLMLDKNFHTLPVVEGKSSWALSGKRMS